MRARSSCWIASFAGRTQRNAVPALSISYKLAHRDAQSQPAWVVHRCLIFCGSNSRPPAALVRHNFAELIAAAATAFQRTTE